MSSYILASAQFFSKSKPESSSTSSPTRSDSTDKHPSTEIGKDSLSTMSPILTELNAKDIRAFEHDRQRTKKAADVVKMKQRKQSARQGGWTRSIYAAKGHINGGFPSEKDKHPRIEEVESFDGLADSRGEYPEVERRHQSGPGLPTHEVKLSDLLTSRKPRKVKEGDFEVIPHVRSVIVLDDFTSQDLVIDEPWEHVYGESDEESQDGDNAAFKTPTYANILSLNK